MKVWLSGTGTLELGQPFGNNAKQVLSAVAFGKTATIKSSGKDRYGRTLGCIFIEDQASNTMMVRIGMAWWYRRYEKTEELENAERYAQGKRSACGLIRTP
ncbi:thermonuclease family protein [Pirellulales bacterium]|nr:thermonuclease family protein [Pirellulales bacterium]